MVLLYSVEHVHGGLPYALATVPVDAQLFKATDICSPLPLYRRIESRPLNYPRSGVAVHALGFMPGVLTIISREMVTIPRVELGGIALATQNWPMIAGRLSTYA